MPKPTNTFNTTGAYDMTLTKHEFEHHDAADYPSGVADTPINVTLLDGSASQWLISQTLTCRGGEINDHDAANKPLLNCSASLNCLRRSGIK
jgi:hypothetical protein